MAGVFGAEAMPDRPSPSVHLDPRAPARSAILGATDLGDGRQSAITPHPEAVSHSGVDADDNRQPEPQARELPVGAAQTGERPGDIDFDQLRGTASRALGPLATKEGPGEQSHPSEGVNATHPQLGATQSRLSEPSSSNEDRTDSTQDRELEGPPEELDTKPESTRPPAEAHGPAMVTERPQPSASRVAEAEPRDTPPSDAGAVEGQHEENTAEPRKPLLVSVAEFLDGGHGLEALKQGDTVVARTMAEMRQFEGWVADRLAPDVNKNQTQAWEQRIDIERLLKPRLPSGRIFPGRLDHVAMTVMPDPREALLIARSEGWTFNRTRGLDMLPREMTDKTPMLGFKVSTAADSSRGGRLTAINALAWYHQMPPVSTKYGTYGATSTGAAVRRVLTDLRLSDADSVDANDAWSRAKVLARQREALSTGKGVMLAGAMETSRSRH